jgi:predicted acylesterase/phospholipase RssA/CRP-like cAMP-binding protein
MADPHLSRAALLDESLEWIFEVTFFARLGAAEQDALLGAMVWRRYAPDQVLVPEGVPTRGVDLIVEGRVALERGTPATALRTLGPGQLVGERSLLRGERTVATVRAVGPVRALHLAPDAFARLLASVTGLRPALEALVTLRERAQELTGLLLRNPILRLLGREGLERLLDASTLERAPAGQRLISAGDRGRDVFLLVEGRLAVYAPSMAGAPRELLATERPGAMIGHAAAMLESPRTADIEPLEPSEFLVVPARAFMDIVSQSPSLQRRLYQQLAAMDLRADDARRARGAGMLVSVYGTRGGVGATTLAYGLAAELSAASPVVLVDTGGAASAARLGLTARHAEARGVAYFAANTPASWRFALAWPVDRAHTRALLDALRAERPDAHVLVAASSRDALDASAMESCEAVVFARPDDDVSDHGARHTQFRVEALRVRPGLTALPYSGPSAVRVPDDPTCAALFWRSGDVEILRDESRPLGRACRRLARVLLGRSVGLALGGGGALGFAHIGLLRTLRAAGIAIDYVAGSSFGAMVAGVYAAGGLEALEELIAQRRRLQVHTWAGMVSSSAIERFVDTLVGRKQMTEVEVPFLPVAMDLFTGRQVVLQRGTIGEGVRSSACLPGPFAAWRRGSWRLADGGIINNVPASVVWEAGAHFIVASNTIPRAMSPDARLPPSLGSLESQLRRFDDMLRATYFLMSQAGRDRSTLADYVFDLDLPMYSVQDMMFGAVIADAGQRQAERELDDILEAWRTDTSARTQGLAAASTVR